MQPDAADFVLRSRPEAVVVETAVTAEHGAATGNSLDLDTPTEDPHLGMFQQLGRRLSWEADPISGPTWQACFSSHLSSREPAF